MVFGKMWCRKGLKKSEIDRNLGGIGAFLASFGNALTKLERNEHPLATIFEMVIPVFHKSQPLAYVLIGDLEDKVEVSPAIKHLPFVQTLTSIIVVAIENKKF